MHATPRFPATFVPHGGGPWPVLSLPMMDDAEGAKLADGMRDIARGPGRAPAFLVVVSAHWETRNVAVHTGSAPGMYYDYGGFPPEAYTLKWPAPGAPEQGEQAIELLRKAGFTVDVEKARGYDHGVFIPLMLAWPQANVPVVQVSLKVGLDPAEHLAIGRALAPLRDLGGYLIGSGNSYHNLRRIFRPDDTARAESKAFGDWLDAAVTAPPTERDRLLADWMSAPAARAAHPREEHLIPLMVVAGAAGADVGRVSWRGTMAGLQLSAHAFG
ncbi:MAG: dioxygenase [Myxococcales bacterium]|nr:dioxygenase [Myxococcales bacterium]